jgi:hypothetical protein
VNIAIVLISVACLVNSSKIGIIEHQPPLLTIARSPGSSLGDTKKYCALAAATSPSVQTEDGVDTAFVPFARAGVAEEEEEEEEEELVMLSVSESVAAGRGLVGREQQLRTMRSNTSRSLRSSMPWLISSTTRKGAEVSSCRAMRYLPATTERERVD